MKFPDMNQYIILLFFLLVEFFLPHRTQPPVARDRPSRSHACPRAWSQSGAGFTRFTGLARDEQDLQDLHDFTGLGLWCAGVVVVCHGGFNASASIVVVNRDNRGNPASADLHGEGQALALR